MPHSNFAIFQKFDYFLLIILNEPDLKNGEARAAIKTAPMAIEAGPIRFMNSLLGAHHPKVEIPAVMPPV